MKSYKVEKLTTYWSTQDLSKRVERELEMYSRDGWVIVSVSFGLNLWWAPTVFITLSKDINQN